MPELVLHVDAVVERLDRYVAAQCPDLSRSQVQRLIRDGRVTVNGRVVAPSYMPAPGDVVAVSLPDLAAPLAPQPESLPLDIVYEDPDLLVVNKPAGLVVHPAPGHPTGTLVNALLAHRPEIANADLDPTRPGIVHRLDRDTSGLIVVAATRQAQQALQASWRSRVVKRYLALVYGLVEPPQALIDAPVGRDPVHRQRFALRERSGRKARTSYQVREYLGRASLLELVLHTGRTHQIRVHMAAVGFPVIGDRVYGPRRPTIAAPRQMLHAWQLSFVHPTSGVNLDLMATPPLDFETLLSALRAPE